MQIRRNDYDVTNRVKTTDPIAVQGEVASLFQLLYPGADLGVIERGFRDVTRMYAGDDPAYLACDTAYHDIQHVMDVTLAMVRLMDGYERSERNSGPLGVRLFQLGLTTALFHDVGYLRTVDDRNAKNGAEYTLSHVSRGATFLAHYLADHELADLAEVAAELIHFTGFEKRVADILIQDPLLRMLGSLLGSADIIAQMSDRCYLEKCRDRLYPEFLAGGVAVKSSLAGHEVVFESGDDLVRKTPAFFDSAVNRLEYDLGGAHNFAATHFGGFNLYMHAATKNVQFAKQISASAAYTLRRALPDHTTGYAH